MKKSAATIRYFYQANQLRLILQGGDIRAVLRAGNHTVAQVQGQEIQARAQLLTADLQGSVIQVQTAQNVHKPLSYTAFGHDRVENDELSLLGYAGERRDLLTAGYALGNGYRTYSPILMRFHSPDRMSPFGKGGINAYSYCTGDPVNNSDPTGHAPIRPRPHWALDHSRLGRANRSRTQAFGSLENLSSPPRPTRNPGQYEGVARGQELPTNMGPGPVAPATAGDVTVFLPRIVTGSSAVAPPSRPGPASTSSLSEPMRSELIHLLSNSQMDRDVEWYLRVNRPDTRKGMSADFLNLPEANDLVRRVNEQRVRQLKVLDRS